MKHQTIVQAQENQTQHTVLASDGISYYTGVLPHRITDSVIAKGESRQ